MSELPINGDYKVVAISPKAMTAISKTKSAKQDKKPSNDKALSHSLDGLSSIMQAKVKPRKKQIDEDANQKLQELAKQRFIDEMVEQICSQGGAEKDSVSREEARDMVNTLIEDGTLENMYKEAADHVKQTLGDAMQNLVDEALEKGRVVSVSELEDIIDNIDNEDKKKAE